MRKDSLIKGTIILAAAAFVARFLGLIQRVPLKHLLDDSGMASYGIAYNVYFLLLIVATAGMPSAISKLVSERIALGREAEAEQIFRTAIRFALIAGVVMTVVLYAAAPFYSVHISHDKDATLAIRALAPALLMFPAIAMMRGYFQGRQNMMAGGLSQIIEQIARVVTAVGLTFLAISLSLGKVWAVAGASFGGVIGGLGALIVMLRYLQRLREEEADTEQEAAEGLEAATALHAADPDGPGVSREARESAEEERLQVGKVMQDGVKLEIWYGERSIRSFDISAGAEPYVFTEIPTEPHPFLSPEEQAELKAKLDSGMSPWDSALGHNPQIANNNSDARSTLEGELDSPAEGANTSEQVQLHALIEPPAETLTESMPAVQGKSMSTKSVLSLLLRLSIPISIISIVVPLIYFIDSSITISLLQDDNGYQRAKDLLGILAGRAQSIAGIPPILAIALSMSIVPIVSSAFARKDMNELTDKASQALRIAVLSGLPLVLCLCIAAKPINTLLFGDADGTWIIIVLTVSSMFQIVMMTSASILMGLGQTRAPMLHVGAGVAVKLAGSYLLAPIMGITGIIAATALCFVLVMVLNLREIRKTADYTILGGRWWGLAATTTVVVLAGAMLQWLAISLIDLPSRILGSAIQSILIAGLVFVWYGLMIARLGVLSAEDLQVLPARVRERMERIKFLWPDEEEVEDFELEEWLSTTGNFEGLGEQHKRTDNAAPDAISKRP